ncbi:hypothetical protein [Streptomyces silvensis]|uniref:hypothetical protein n=1 Tax=Streptomyces silvensis TaxID=1765722 RepID=UPI000A448F97|nr:hypothetical protein [Streptomyces silvensis]
MSRTTVLAPKALLAAVLLALVAVVGAFAPQSHASEPATRNVPAAHMTQTTTALGTTTRAAVASDFVITSLMCSANRTQGGPGQITCTVRWTGGEPNFDPVFRADPGGSTPVTSSNNANRFATFTFGCVRSIEYTVTVFIRDRNGIETPPQTRPYIPCGNF